MALRSSLALVILLLVLQQLKLCKGELQTAEVYEIDYKGPETHAFLPPPDHSRFAPSTGNKSKKPKVWKALANMKQAGGR